MLSVDVRDIFALMISAICSPSIARILANTDIVAMCIRGNNHYITPQLEAVGGRQDVIIPGSVSFSEQLHSAVTKQALR